MIGPTLLLLQACLQTHVAHLVPLPNPVPNLIVSEKAIVLAPHPETTRAYNGSIVLYRGMTVLAVRFDSQLGSWNAQTQVGVVTLDENDTPRGEMSFLETRVTPGIVRYTAEDPRLFVFQDELYVTYNSTESNDIGANRQVYLGRLSILQRPDGSIGFRLAATRQLTLARPGGTEWMEKSWVPLVDNERLFMVYKQDPPEVYQVPLDAFPLKTLSEKLPLLPVTPRPSQFGFSAYLDPAETAQGASSSDSFFGRNLRLEPPSALIPQMTLPLLSRSTAPRKLEEDRWAFGPIRGGTPTFRLPDGRFGTFFHSGIYFDSGFGHNKHYFMGFYVLAAAPPFAVEEMLTVPILPPVYYGPHNGKRIIFPAGVIETEKTYRVSFGLNDEMTWIAEVDKGTLFALLVPANGP